MPTHGVHGDDDKMHAIQVNLTSEPAPPQDQMRNTDMTNISCATWQHKLTTIHSNAHNREKGSCLTCSANVSTNQ